MSPPTRSEATKPNRKPAGNLGNCSPGNVADHFPGSPISRQRWRGARRVYINQDLTFMNFINDQECATIRYDTIWHKECCQRFFNID